MAIGQKGIQKTGWFYPTLPFGFRVTNETGTATLTESECGLVFVRSTGSTTLTLPEPNKGLWYMIFNCADQDLTVATATADTLITFNDAAAGSVDFDQSGNKIGGALLLVNDGTNWVAVGLGAHTLGVNT